jgi:hypothetical protein
MAIIYTSSLPFDTQRIMAVAVYCSDGRFGNHLDEFLQEHLRLPRYDRLALPGGAAWLSWQSSMSISHHSLMNDQFDFLVQAHGLRRAVLIAHYGCAYYALRCGGDADTFLPTQIRDLQDVAERLRRRYPALQIECYLARSNGDRVDFETVSPDRFAPDESLRPTP